jgi:hypothetical protein
MPRILWPLLLDRPIIEVELPPTTGGQALVRRLIADTGAGTAQCGFELLLPADDCLQCGGGATRSRIAFGVTSHDAM